MKIRVDSPEMRHRARKERQVKRLLAQANWHFHFCWWPVRWSDTRVAWLETVARRRYGGTWGYAPVTKILEGE